MKILKWLGIILITALILLAAYLWVISKPKPVGSDSQAADILAEEMLTAINKPAWDSLKYLQWNFNNMHKYLYNKEENKVIVTWDDVEVLLDLDKVDGDVMVGKQYIEGDKKNKYIQNAWSYWCNDSFWAFAPYKVFDPGTTRTIATDHEGKQGLMVSYDSGGVTPGDSYLWYLDDKKVPTGYRMWVKIIPVGGVYASWEDWHSVEGGAMISKKHDMKVFVSTTTEVKAGNSYKEYGYTSDPFVLLE